jgi:hypothetical protein
MRCDYFEENPASVFRMESFLPRRCRHQVPPKRRQTAECQNINNDGFFIERGDDDYYNFTSHIIL